MQGNPGSNLKQMDIWDKGCMLKCLVSLLGVAVGDGPDMPRRWSSPLCLHWPWGLQAWRTMASRVRRVHVLCLGCFTVFHGDGEMMATSWSQNKVLRSFPCSGGALSTNGGRVKLCVLRVFWNPFRFHVCWYGFRSRFSDLRVSSLAVVSVLAH
jgi:hypothetical protein